MDEFKVLDVVALMEDLDAEGLRRGEVGTIVEGWNAGAFEVEFSDDNGRTYAMLALQADQLMTLYYQPMMAA